MKKVILSFGRISKHAPKITSRHLGLRNFQNVAYKTDGKDDDDDDDVAVKELRKLGQKHQKSVDELKADYQKAQKALEDSQSEIETLKKESKSADEEIQKAKAEAKAAADKVEALEKKLSTEFAEGRKGVKSFEQSFEETLGKKEHVDAIKSRQPNYPVELSVKAVGDMGSAANLTGAYFVAPDVKPGIIIRPYDQLHMRDLLPIGRTTSNLIRHVRDNGGEGGPGMVAEMGTKPQMDRDLSIEDAPVRKVATHIRVPEEMIEDIPYLVSFISNIGVEEVMAVEDAQIIYGDGTGQNLSGLFTNATAFAPGATAIVASPNRFDVVRAARMQMRKLKRVPSFCLVSPLDYYLMTSVKDSTGNYILQGGGNGLVPTLDGVPIVEMNQMVDNDFLLGDRRSAEINFRQNVVLRFFDQDRDNAIKNAITIVIEERLALPIYYTNGLIKGTFTAGITDLTS